MSQHSLLQKNDHGAGVRLLQKMLIAQGYGDLLGTHQADSHFGPNTKKALEKFQADHHLDTDGIAGPDTWAALTKKAAAKPAPASETETSAPTPVAKTASNGWHLSVQKTGTETSPRGYLMATGTLTLTEPNGTQHTYPMRSGGYGSYKDASMLPGLDAPLGHHEGLNATYKIDWSNLLVDSKSKDLPAGSKGKDGRGSWVRLGSVDTDRGGVIGKDHEGFFGIHTDGKSVRNGYPGDGTLGCVGLEPKIAKQFFAKMMTIPKSHRPQQLDVLPTPEMERAIAAFTAPELSPQTAGSAPMLFPQKQKSEPVTSR